MPADPTRRRALALTALGAAGMAGLGGCGWITPWSAPPRPGADVGVLADAIAAEHSMIARYQAVITGVPAVGPAVTPLLRQHQEHLDQLAGRLVVPSGSTYRRPAAAPRPPAFPATAAAALAYLRAAERDAAAELVRRLTAVPASLAQLMASIGASEASHAAVLESPALLRSAAAAHQEGTPA